MGRNGARCQTGLAVITRLLVCSCSPFSCPSLSLQPFALVFVAPGVGWSGEGRHGARCKSGLVVVVTMAGLWLRMRVVG